MELSRYIQKKLNSTNLPTYINYNVFETVKARPTPHTRKLNVQISFPYAGAISLIC